MYDKLLSQILSLYDLPASLKVRHLAVGQHSTYLLSTARGSKWILRGYESGIRSKEAIQAELNVLSYLAEIGYLKVPAPLPNRNGDLLTAVERNKLSSLEFAIFKFVDGKKLGLVGSNRMKQIGDTLGVLDNQLLDADVAITPVPSNSRIHWNEEAFIDWPLDQLKTYNKVSSFLGNGQLPKWVLDLASQLRAEFITVKNLLPHQLLHADAHLGNLTFDRRQIGIIDFDDLGFAPRIYELVPPLGSLHIREIATHIQLENSKIPMRVADLLAGYSKQILLSNVEVTCLPLFQAIRLFADLGWNASRSHLPSKAQFVIQYGEEMLLRSTKLLELFANN